MQKRLIDVLLDYLRAEEARVVFGVPGGLLHPFFEAVENQDDFRLIIAKHEAGAAFMADGYARTGGRLAVAAATSGPGATNLLTGVACAFTDGVPMLVITGQAQSHLLGKGAAQETGPEGIDSVGMFKPVTKYSAMVTGPERFVHQLERALRQAFTGRPGPVHLNVPVDLWERMIEVPETIDTRRYRMTTNVFDRNAVQDACTALLEAEFPVILVGSGVGTAKAQEHVRTLAELIPARIVTTPRAKGLFPEDHELSLGVLGFAGHRAARETVLGKTVDVLMTIGASLNETTTFNWSPDLQPSKKLIQLDIDAERLGVNYPVDVPLVGDAQAIAIELVYHIHRSIRAGAVPRSRWSQIPPPPRGEERYQDVEQRSIDALPLQPQRWRKEIDDVLPDDAVIITDVGGHTFFNVHHLDMKKKRQFVLQLNFGSMGHGTACPVGVQLANPDKAVVAIVGDACFTMNGMEVLTASGYDVPVVWIVENNQMHGIIWHGSQLVGKRKPMKSIVYKKPLDIAGIARAMGVSAFVVDAPGQMGPTLQRALAERRTAVIEVKVDGRVSPPIGDRAKSVAGFSKPQ
jgi:acetolactate synthase-1/2/3 large subunit